MSIVRMPEARVNDCIEWEIEVVLVVLVVVIGVQLGEEKGEVPQAEPLRGGGSSPPEDLVQSRRPQLLKLEKNRAGLICAQLTQYT